MDDILRDYGLAGLVISVLAGTVIFLYRQIVSLNKQLMDIQNQRIIDAKETRDKLAGPMEEQAQLSKAMYDILLNLNGNRRP